MRRVVLALAIAAALAGSAVAQPSTPYQSGFTSAATAVGSLPQEARDWVLGETARQAESPTSLAEIDKAMEEEVGAMLQSAAKSLRAGRKDLASAIRYEIVREARRMVDRELREWKKEARADLSDEMMLALKALEARRIRLGALENQANNRLTAKARGILAD